MRDKTFYSIFVGGYKLSRSAFQTIDLEGYICSICEALSDKVYKEYLMRTTTRLAVAINLFYLMLLFFSSCDVTLEKCFF